MFAKGLVVASNNYLRSKDHHGLFYNREHRPSIDDYHGTRHQAMMALQEHLSRAGTTTEEIEKLMGTPTKILDKPDEPLLCELKRNNENYEYPLDTKIWVYEWRSNHDYVYFLISKDHKVIQSAWYYAFE